MDYMKGLLLTPLIAVMLTSGCTSIPGLDGICIPFLTCGNVVEYPDDVIVIKSLDALPQKASPGQQIRLVAYIQNTGKDPVPQDDFRGFMTQGISADLYDFCQGIFDVASVNCGDQQITGSTMQNTECNNIKLLPGEIKEIGWTLKASQDVKLRTECDLKVSVNYPYKTTSLTMITFIDYQEMQRQLNEGTLRKRESYIVTGYGPVKPTITVEDQQPIPVQQNEPGRTVVSLKIRNAGNGFLCRQGGTSEQNIVCDGKLPNINIKIEGIGYDSGLTYSSEPGATCAFPSHISGTLMGPPSPYEFITLIRGESPPLLCQIEISDNVNIPKETTKHITTEIEYLYEFRDEINVVIEPLI
jgi:hypothetical protein